MIEEVQNYCRRTGQKIPETPGELAKVIYVSLALCYRETADQIEKLTGRQYDTILSWAAAPRTNISTS